MQQCAPQVAPDTLHAIVMTESQGQPFQIGVNSGAALVRQPVSMPEAVATARSLLARGANFDVGLTQVNSDNFDKLGLTPENMFDPCTNLRAGAAVLQHNYKRAREKGVRNPLAAAISTYNTGSMSRGFGNGYVAKVYRNAGSLEPAVPSGGGWTAQAVARVVADAFDARITDTWRPMNASYGATNSFHKYGQAVDFVPRAGLHSITRQQIRSVLGARGIRVVELLGPGDPEHDDHWHVAFATSDAPERPSAPVMAAMASNVKGDVELGEAEVAPPAWNVFAVQRWRERTASSSAAADSFGGVIDGSQ